MTLAAGVSLLFNWLAPRPAPSKTPPPRAITSRPQTRMMASVWMSAPPIRAATRLWASRFQAARAPRQSICWDQRSTGFQEAEAQPGLQAQQDQLGRPGQPAQQARLAQRERPVPRGLRERMDRTERLARLVQRARLVRLVLQDRMGRVPCHPVFNIRSMAIAQLPGGSILPARLRQPQLRV